MRPVNDLAILRVDGPRVVRFGPAHPFPVRITVRNEGEGSMPGTVSSNVPWMQISPSQLDPNRRTQVIEALVEPDGISGNAAKGVVTIDTLHGESRTVTIDAIKHIVSPVMLFVTALSLVGFIGLFAGLYLSGIIGSSVESLSHLGVNVDLRQEVYIDDELVGNQGTVSVVDNFIGTPFSCVLSWMDSSRSCATSRSIVETSSSRGGPRAGNSSTTSLGRRSRSHLQS